MLLIIVTLGILANTKASVIATLLGLIIALAFCLLGMRALGFDGDLSIGGLLKFNFSLHRDVSVKQLAVAITLLALSIGTAWVSVRVAYASSWLVTHMPSLMAPHPNEDLVVVFIFCGAFTLTTILSFLIHKQWLHNLENMDLPKMNRSERRAEGIGKEQLDNYNKALTKASKRTEYWTEASLLLGLATVALLPGALGWNWLWGVALSVVLPMFVLSVRFRVN